MNSIENPGGGSDEKQPLLAILRALEQGLNFIDDAPSPASQSRSYYLLTCFGTNGLIEDRIHGDYHYIFGMGQLLRRLLQLLHHLIEYRA